MATIQNYIELGDGVSPVLDRINQATTTVSNKFDRLSRSTTSMAGALDRAEGSANRLGDVFKGALGANVAIIAIDKVQESIASLFATADQYAGIQARLGLVAGSQVNAAYLNYKIYESAQRARGGYMDMAHAVSQLAMSAKDAFPDPREAVNFMEGINKLYAIGGTTGENKKFATLQLTQGLASGQLQGDEFRSIAENAPIIENMIAKTMGVSRGELKKLASQGEVTSEIIKRAVLENMDEINAQFAQVPKTWGDRFTDVKNRAMLAFTGIYLLMSQAANSPMMDKLVAGVSVAIDYIAGATFLVVNNMLWLGGIIINGLGSAFQFLSNNSWIVYGALFAIGGYLTFLAAMWAINTVQVGLAAAAMIAKSIADAAETAAIIALTIAQDGLNAALYACPITWIIAAIIVLIGIFYFAVAAVNYFAGTSISATGLIFGAFSWLYARVRNIIALMWNLFAAVANFWGSVFNDPMAAVQNLFADVWNAVSGYVAEAINTIFDMLLKIPGMTKLGLDLSHVTASTVSRVEVSGGAAYEVPTMDYVDPGEYAQSGYEMGKGVADNIGKMMDNPTEAIKDIMGQLENPQYDPTKVAPGSPASVNDPTAKDNAKNNAKTAKNTERMARAIEMTDDEIKALRDSAISETIQKWQNQHIEIKVDNTINATSDVDLDGFTSDFATGLREAIKAEGEGVLA